MLIDDKYYNSLIGEFSSCYVGYSTDLKIRENSASGGLITQLLCYLLDKGEIDGAVVTKVKVINGEVRLNSFIAKTIEEIIGAAGSHYLKADFSKVIREILKEEGKFAIVATPCIIRSLRIAQEKIPGLREKIYCLFGLFCGTPFNNNIFTYIYSKTVKNRNNVAELKFRVGWPNFKMRIKSTNSDYYLPLDKWIFFHDIGLYVEESCLNCHDALAEYADISFGDAWIKEIVLKDKIGTSICICRTTKGEVLIKDAINDNKIYLKKTSACKVIDSQKFVLYFKKLQKKNKLITFPTRFLKRLLNNFSNKYPDNSAKIPILFYKLMFYFVVFYLMVIWKLDEQHWKNEKI
jgi:coenzyme F420 hydrogenase subunit beta